jgi:hypothetical protein
MLKIIFEIFLSHGGFLGRVFNLKKHQHQLMVFSFQFFFVYASLTFLQTNGLDVIANIVVFVYEFLVIFITIFSTEAAKKESLEMMKLIRKLRFSGVFKREVIFCGFE